MKTFTELFETILNGDKESSRLAAREVRTLVYGAQTGAFDEMKLIINNAPEEYGKIKEEFRQEHFVMAVSVMYFLHDKEKAPDFLFPWLFHLLRHKRGNIRFAAVRMLESELGPLTVHLRCPDFGEQYNTFSRVEAEQILADMFISLVSMANAYWKPAYEKYKYVSDLPSGSYKSIQMVLVRLADDCGKEFMKSLRKRKKEPKRPDNGLSETIQALSAWITKNEDRFVHELSDARNMFWADRDGVAPIEESDVAGISFTEWLMYDFSTNGYDDVPYGERKNFLSVFLSECSKELSPSAHAFARLASDSRVSIYRALSVEVGIGETIEDVFTGEIFDAKDRNLSLAVTPGVAFLGRFVKDASGTCLGIGSMVHFLTPPEDEMLKFLIEGALTMTAEEEGAELDLPMFLKWNSYIYYREILSWHQRGFPYDREACEEILGQSRKSHTQSKSVRSSCRSARATRRRKRTRLGR